MAKPFKEQFVLAFGRDPTDAEFQHFHRFLTATDIKENDSLVGFYLFEQSNLARLESIPAAISNAATAAENAAKRQSKAAIDTAVSGAVPQLVKCVDEQVATISKARAMAERSKWLMWCAAGCMVALLSVGGFGYWLGSKEIDTVRKTAFTEGSKANAWLATIQGKQAYEWYVDGTIEHMIRCDKPGWRIAGTSCIPDADRNDNIYGWPIK